MRVVKVSRAPMTSNYLPSPKQVEACRSKRHDKTPKMRKAAKFSGTAPAQNFAAFFIYEISPLAYANSVCGFPKGTLRKVASLRSSAVSTQFVEPRQGSASLAHAK